MLDITQLSIDNLKEGHTVDLCLGSRNNYVRVLEQRLKALDLYSGPIDGIFGGGVESGLKEFQSTHNLQCDGIVGPETWSALFPGTPQPVCELLKCPLAERCLALTGAFETTAAFPDCFAGLAGDFDGEGISFGVLQWNIGQGTLQPLFAQMLQDQPHIMRRIFQDNLAQFTNMLSLSRDEQLAWWIAIQTPDTAELFEPWKGYLLTLGTTAPFQQIQMDHSEKIYSGACALAREYDLHTERGVALMFDACVQNGWIEPETKTLIETDFAAIPSSASRPSIEVARMQAIANRVAESSRPEYVEDVRTRKLTIANGAGIVHGMYYDLLSQYDIALVSAEIDPQ
jgi:hypothetical protein